MLFIRDPRDLKKPPKPPTWIPLEFIVFIALKFLKNKIQVHQ
jgi:hypothetical protein